MFLPEIADLNVKLITTDDRQSYVILSYQNYSCKFDFRTTRDLKLSDIW